MIGDEVKYGKVILRNCKCWRCKHKGQYEWRTPRYGQKIPNSKKMYCNKTKRWGSTKRAYFCKHFESNSNSYKDPGVDFMTTRETSERSLYGRPERD